MAKHCRLASAAAVAMCDALADYADGGTGAAQIIIYTGTEPSYANDTAGTEVATLTCNDPAFGAATADATNHWAEVDLDVDPAVTDSSATGNAAAVTYFRIVQSDGTTVMLQGTVGTSDCDLNLNSTSIGAGVSVTITAMQLRVPYNQA